MMLSYGCSIEFREMPDDASERLAHRRYVGAAALPLPLRDVAAGWLLGHVVPVRREARRVEFRRALLRVGQHPGRRRRGAAGVRRVQRLDVVPDAW